MRAHRRLLLLSLCATACAAPSTALECRSLDALLAEVRAEHGVPGLAAIVGERGQIVASGVAGAAADQCWHIASCAKLMTAVAVERLVDRGALRLESTMAEVFPEMRDDMHPRLREVTVADLLAHRSGLPANESSGSAFTRRIDSRASAAEQRLEITAAALAATPECEPGTRRVYANTNYLIAGAVVERVSGRVFDQALRELVFVPMGLASAGFGQPPAHPGHRRVFGRAVPARPDNLMDRLPGYYAPAGDVHLSMADWARFVAGCDGRVDFTRPAPGAASAKQHGRNPWWSAVAEVVPAQDRFVLVACDEGGDRGNAACADALARLHAASVEGWRANPARSAR